MIKTVKILENTFESPVRETMHEYISTLFMYGAGDMSDEGLKKSVKSAFGIEFTSYNTENNSLVFEGLNGKLVLKRVEVTTL